MKTTLFVDMQALVWNYRFLCAKAGSAEVGAVIKANAYGLGMPAIAQRLYAEGCKTFFTAHFEEALRLRALAPHAQIIALHGVEKGAYEEARAQNITPALNHLDAIETWSAFAKKTGTPAPACIHLDTGMNRLGLSPREQARLAANHALLDGLKIKAWVSHFACADAFDNPMTPMQRNKFVDVLRALPPAPASLANSSGIFWGKDYLFDLVRPGIALYGGNPTPHLPNPMRNVVEVRVPILQIREIEKAMTVGYGASHKASRDSRIATLEIGYADGYPRSLSNTGHVRLGAFSAPLVGRVSMDLVTIDVTDIPENVAHVGAMATLIGPHRPIDQVATEAGTLSYEILTSLNTSRFVLEYTPASAKEKRDRKAA